jgi:hypothetical protein
MDRTLEAVKGDAKTKLENLESAINEAIRTDNLAWFSSDDGRNAYDLARILKATIKEKAFEAATMSKEALLMLPVEDKAIMSVRKEKAEKTVKGFKMRCARVGL